MNSQGTFQDLLNLNTTNEDIQNVQDELKALAEEVKDNTDDIASNLVLINNNTTGISNNGVLINNNTSNIATNTQNLALENLRITLNANEILAHDGEINTLQLDRIADEARITINEQNIQTNVNNIQTNTIALTTLGNDVLRKDGSVLLDVGYTPTQPQSISTKDYVDNSIGGSTQFLKIDGSNSMTGDLEMNGNDLKIDGNTSKFFIENFSNNLVMASQNNLIFNRAGAIDMEVASAGINLYKRLDMSQQNIINAPLINGFDLSTFNSNISTNTGNINTNTGNITTNTGNINTNTGNITTNTNNILTNTNTIPTKLSLSGGTMTGAIDMDNSGITNASFITSFGDILTNNYIKTNLLFPISGTDIFIPGSAGIRPSFIQSNFGTNSLLCKSDLDMQTNDITNVGLVDGFDLNTFDSNITSLATNLGNETVSRISGDSALAGDISTNTGNISTNATNISTNATAINTKLPSSGSSITATTPFFKIDGGNNSCELRICADSGNDNEAFNPKIVFQQDGSVQTGAVFLKNNELNISSAATSNAGLVFRTSTTNGGWATAPIRMTIKSYGDVEYEHSIRVKSTNEFEFGFGVPFKNQYSGRCTYKGFSGYALDFVGAAVGAADRQIQIYEDLTLKAVIQTSDERLKHHIRPIEIKMAGELIDNLQPKCFMWKNIDRLTGEVRDFTDHHCYMGLIAQEVKTVQDTIGDSMGEKLRISRNPKNEKDFMSVSYTQLIAPMMKCIQDLRTRVKLLEEKINTLV